MQICKRCVMDDSSDKTITFNEQGYCNYCENALSEINTTVYYPGAEGQQRLDEMLRKIKTDGVGKKYDCIMGLSGGLDSSYLAYLGCKWGLRILAVHIDDGYDTEISKQNLKKLCEAGNIEMRTIIPDAEQYNMLTLAYMKAGVSNLAVPQDNILFAFLYDVVKESGVKYFLSGGNFALECIYQGNQIFNPMDTVNIKDIHKRFGTAGIDKLKFISSYKKYIQMKTGKIATLRPLNYIDYNRKRAFKQLKEFCCFEYYGGKHLENILTAFVQLVWYPQKFGIDKRKGHLSSMIVSGQMTRDEALHELSKPMYDVELMSKYISIIKRNMKLTDAEFEAIMAAPAHEHTDYKIDKLSVLLRKFVK